MKESENVEKFLDLAGELKKLSNVKVAVKLICFSQRRIKDNFCSNFSRLGLIDEPYFSCDFSNCCFHLYCSQMKHKVSVIVSPLVYPIYQTLRWGRI